ncbi:alpha/beta-hydrolase [Agrocybe pediades]|nr:alpha/beta-hydrolase [Agrocybe pediades]
MAKSVSASLGYSLPLQIDHLVLDTSYQGANLKTTINRYRPHSIIRRPGGTSRILLLLHGIGYHKEQWGPTLQYLFDLDRASKGTSTIVEAWAIDYPSHGEAAELNAKALEQRPELLSIRSCAAAIHKLLTSELLERIQDGTCKVTLIGHSAGSIATTLAASLFDNPRELFSEMISIEPSFWFPESRMTDTYRIMEKLTPSRRRRWDSKQMAYDWFKNRAPWSLWDPVVLKLYTKHGLKVESGARDGAEAAVLRCNPSHESFIYAETDAIYEAVRYLGHLCRTFPCHLIFGERIDIVSRDVQDSIIDPKAGRDFASVTRIEGTGHLVLQEKPARLAEVLYRILQDSQSSCKL